MACIPISLSGLAASCDGSMGGIKRIWIAPWDPSVFTKVYHQEGSSATNYIESISGITGATSQVWKLYNFPKNTSSLTNTVTIDNQNGIKFVQTALALIFSRQETAKRIEVSALLLGQVMCVVEDSNGNFQVLGVENPVESSEAGGTIGAQKTDGNNYTITITDESVIYPPFLTKEAAQAFVDDVK